MSCRIIILLLVDRGRRLPFRLGLRGKGSGVFFRRFPIQSAMEEKRKRKNKITFPKKKEGKRPLDK